MRGLMHRWTQRRPVLVVVLMASYSAQSLLITASKQRGGFAYDATVAVLLAEVAKLAFAVAMLSPKARASLRPSRGCLAFALPAVLYTAQNRLVFEALRRLSPPEYQMLNNLKLFTTSAVYRVAMRRQLKVLQWLALLLLGLGMALATEPLPEGGCSGSFAPGLAAPAASRAAPDAGTWLSTGVAIMVAVSWCSACAGVLNEWLIKRSDDVLEANLWLYAFGVLACCWQLTWSGEGWPRILRLEGFTAVTWLVVLCNAVLGQTIAFLFRYADSIVKLYAVCAAMAFTTAMSVALFGFEVRFKMVAGYLAVAISMCLYYMPAEVLLAPDAEALAGLCSARRSGQGKAA